MALTAKQKIFVEAYLTTWNATESARRAGYSEKTARAIGHENLTKPYIAEEIKRRIAERTMSADEVLTRLAEQARAEYSRYFRPNGTVDLRAIIDDGKAHLIKGIKETQWGTVVDFYDAHAAKELIGKHHRLFTDKVEHGGEVQSRIVIEYADDDKANPT